MSLGERIYKHRTGKNLSQGDLADILDVSRQSISKWETNSSVPELDKLVKLSEAFDVSLDELITGNVKDKGIDSSNSAQKVVPQIVYIEKNQKPNFSTAQILGVILLFCSLLAFVLFACFGKESDLFEVFILCLPVAVWGIICLVAKHPLLWCGWFGSITWWIYVFVLSVRWEKAVFLLVIGILLVIASLLYTIYLHKNAQIHIPTWAWVMLLVVLTAAILLLAINIIPPLTGTITKSTEIQIAPDASIVPE